jgi:hypothetical protein
MESMYKGVARMQDIERVLDSYDKDFPKDALRLCFTSNHDENSHSGSEYERLGNAVKAFAVLCATCKNSLPLIYSGQEMPNKARLKFFDKDVIKWTGQYLLHDFYKVLFTLRKDHPAMQSGDPTIHTYRLQTTSDENVLAFVREKGDDKVIVILNLSHNSKLKFSILNFEETQKYESIYSGLDLYINNETVFEMQEWEYLVYVK